MSIPKTRDELLTYFEVGSDSVLAQADTLKQLSILLEGEFFSKVENSSCKFLNEKGSQVVKLDNSEIELMRWMILQISTVASAHVEKLDEVYGGLGRLQEEAHNEAA